MFSERTQVLLSKEQVGRLRRLATAEQRSLGAVIRSAIDAYTDADVSIERRRAALEDLVSLDLPVDDWAVMKAEMMRGRYGEIDPDEPPPPEDE